MGKLKGGKKAEVCNINAEMIKGGGETMIHGLHAVQSVIWQSSIIPPDWKKWVCCPYLERERGRTRPTITRPVERARQSVHLLALDANSVSSAKASGT